MGYGKERKSGGGSYGGQKRSGGLGTGNKPGSNMSYGSGDKCKAAGSSKTKVKNGVQR